MPALAHDVCTGYRGPVGVGIVDAQVGLEEGAKMKLSHSSQMIFYCIGRMPTNP